MTEQVDLDALIAEAREEDWHAAGFSNTLRLMHELADALTAVSAERDAAVVKLPDCDGGCDYNSGPEETCSAHGRPVAEVWRIVQDVAAERDEALEVAEGYVRLHKAITEALAEAAKGDNRMSGVQRILRAALDKKGNGHE